MLFAMIGRLTQESLAAFVENPIDRFGPASQSIKAAGGELKEMYQTPEGMVFLILDAPDAQVITAISVGIQSTGRLKDVRIHRLQTTAGLPKGVGGHSRSARCRNFQINKPARPGRAGMSAVGSVESVWRYPVKSIRGETVTEAYLALASPVCTGTSSMHSDEKC